MNQYPKNKPIDFKGIARVALVQAEALLRQWLPEGTLNGGEYKSTNPTRSDKSPNSFSINIRSGVWSDFATGDSGNDLIGLYAYLNQFNQGKAAVEVARMVGYPIDNITKKTAPLMPAQVSEVQASKARSGWVAVTPVPDFALNTATKSHFKRGEPTHRWAYRNEKGELLGYVCRFTTSDGGKEVLPLVFARNEQDGSMKWTWVQWPEPRPLYLAGLNLSEPITMSKARTLIVVEGEKCADALAAWLINNNYLNYDVVTWSGGCKAVKKADWVLVKDYERIILWADRDLKHDKNEHFLPRFKQPGVSAMLVVAEVLRRLEGASVKDLRLLVTGDEATDGYDVVDAIEAGLDVAKVLGEAVEIDSWLSIYAPKTLASDSNLTPLTKKTSTSGMGLGASDFDQEYQMLRNSLILSAKGCPRAVRENVFYCLSKLSEWRGVIAFDEFSNRVVKTKKTPFGTTAGEWNNSDDLQLGLWLAENMDLIVPSGQVLVEGVALTANKNRIHPPRDYLNSLAWDGSPRLDVWLTGAFGARELTRVDGEYLRLVGRKFMIAAVARIFEPGCHVDNMIVLEGDQGRGKSTAIRILFGDWFADTQLDLNSKDAMAQLDGVWGYEIGEMDSFSRAEATKVKGFITSRVDRYRAAFERRTEAHARSTVFIGTTNQDEYLKDPTGARRFWPVRVNDWVDFDWLRSERDQLWAEAMALYKKGERWHVTSDEQRDIFTAEQAAREVQDGWLELVAKWLSSDDMTYKIAGGITTGDVLKGALNYPPDKLSATKQESGRIGSVMKTLGFKKKRAPTVDDNGYRGYIFTK